MTLKRVDPPRQADKVSIDQAWLRLQEAIAAADAEIGGEAGLSNVLFVDLVTGDNLTAQRGSLVFKYATIQAALDDALTGDTVWVSPGLYGESLTWPAVRNITLRGMGSSSPDADAGAATVVFSEAAPVINIVPAVTVAAATILDLYLSSSSQDCIHVDGAAAATMFNDGLVLKNISVNREIDIRSVNNVYMQNVFSENAANNILRTIDVSKVTINGAAFYQMDLDYNLAPAAPPAGGNVGIVATNCMVYNSVTYRDLAKAAFGDECQLGSVVGLPIDNATNDCGFISCSGRVVGNINIDFNFTNANEGDYEVCRFDYCRVSGAFDVDGTGTQDGIANARNAIMFSGPATAGEHCTMDLRGTLVDQASLAVTDDGTIDRDSHYILQGANAGMGAVVVTITPPFPSGADYNVITEMADLGDGVVGITAKGGASFTRTTLADNNGTIQFALIRTLNV